MRPVTLRTIKREKKRIDALGFSAGTVHSNNQIMRHHKQHTWRRHSVRGSLAKEQLRFGRNTLRALANICYQRSPVANAPIELSAKSFHVSHHVSWATV